VRSLEGAEEVAGGSPAGRPAAGSPDVGNPAAGPSAASAAAAGSPAVALEWLRSVASHELDPYAAADAILDQLIGGGPAPEPNT
jgi:hypothetical protein